MKKHAKGFIVSWKGVDILRHRENRPCVGAAAGTGMYTCSHGNFTIKEKKRKRMGSGSLIPGEDTLTGSELLFQCGGVLGLRLRELENYLEMDFRDVDPVVNRIDILLAAPGREAVYGCGEQYSYVDLKGRQVPLWVQEQGVGRGKGLISLLADAHSDAGGSWYTTYFPVTGFVTTDGFWCLVDTTGFAVFDFRRKSRYRLKLWHLPAKILIGKEQNLEAVLSAFSAALGRQPMLPEWVYDGMWLGVQGGTETVEGKLKNALDAGVRVSGLWAQDWEGKRITTFGKQLMWNWKYDPSLYPELPGFIEDLKKRGLRFLGYINPFLATEGDLYAEAKEKGYCVQKPGGGDYLVEVTTFPAAIVDLTNPEAVAWIKGVITEHMIGIGLSGWMADFGEYLPTDAVLHSGESAELVHNRYPVDWARTNYEAVRDAGRLGDIVYFMRAGYTGSAAWSTAYWAGDQLVDWSLGDGLATAITAGITAGLSGVGYYHSDIGGYTSLAWIKRTREIFQRWAEFAAFTQIMRSHEGNRPDTSWQFDSDRETLLHLAAMTRLYTSLKPYHMALSQKYQESGIPPMRPVAMHYPEETRARRLKYQYLYGRDLLVAPVVKKGARRWKVYLPEDKWTGFWDGALYGGGIVEVKAPLGRPPVFYRSHSPWKDLFLKAAEEGQIEKG
jgi:sulfoquinovosidase